MGRRKSAISGNKESVESLLGVKNHECILTVGAHAVPGERQTGWGLRRIGPTIPGRECRPPNFFSIMCLDTLTEENWEGPPFLPRIPALHSLRQSQPNHQGTR